MEKKPSPRFVGRRGTGPHRRMEEGPVNQFPERPLTRSVQADHPLPASRGEGRGLSFSWSMCLFPFHINDQNDR